MRVSYARPLLCLPGGAGEHLFDVFLGACVLLSVLLRSMCFVVYGLPVCSTEKRSNRQRRGLKIDRNSFFYTRHNQSISN